MKGVRVERLDHLGIVAGVCEEIGLATYLDAVAGATGHQVSVGTATVAMILNGLGFSNCRLYLVSQFFATKPVEHLLGSAIAASASSSSATQCRMAPIPSTGASLAVRMRSVYSGAPPPRIWVATAPRRQGALWR